METQYRELAPLPGRTHLTEMVGNVFSSHVFEGERLRACWDETFTRPNRYFGEPVFTIGDWDADGDVDIDIVHAVDHLHGLGGRRTVKATLLRNENNATFAKMELPMNASRLTAAEFNGEPGDEFLVSAVHHLLIRGGRIEGAMVRFYRRNDPRTQSAVSNGASRLLDDGS